jgi:hypothetical protein
MNPEDLRLAGSALGSYLAQFGIDTAKTAGKVGAEALGKNIGKRIGGVISAPGTNVDPAQNYAMQKMMMEHNLQLQMLAAERALQQEKHLQGLETIHTRHSYDSPGGQGIAGPTQAGPAYKPPGMAGPSFNVADIYRNAAGTNYFS